MYVDANLILSGSLSATTNALSGHTVTTTAVSTNVVEMQVIAADDTALSTHPKVLSTTGPVVTASLTQGARFALPIAPQIGSTGKRYLGVKYVVSGTYTSGAIFADLGIDLQDGQKFYAAGFSVT